jgi:hypothetical protein
MLLGAAVSILGPACGPRADAEPPDLPVEDLHDAGLVDAPLADLARTPFDARPDAPDLAPPGPADLRPLPPDLGPCSGVACGPFRFDPPVIYPITGWTVGPRSLEAADFNGDGRPDLVAACNSGFISILVNLGGGKFAPEHVIPVKRSALSIAAADYDGDGRVDLAVSTELGYVISVFLNRGNLQFIGPIETAVPSAPFYLSSADFNEDGRPDIISGTGGGANSVLVLLNTGGGKFAVREDQPVPRAPIPQGWADLIDSMIEVLARDLDGDGHADIIAAYYYLGPERPKYDDRVLVLFGDGKGGFQGPFFRTNTGTYTLGAGDADGDGRIDLVLGEGRAERVDVLLNTGKRDDPGMLVQHSAKGDGLGALTVGDLDRDGRPDVVAVGGRSARLLRNLGGGKLSYLQALPVIPSQSLNTAVLRDLDGDGRLDLAIGYLPDLQSPKDAVAVFLNRTP